MRNRIALGAITLVFVGCIPSFGQVLKGSISGTVVDPRGAVVSGARVKATQMATGEVFTTSSGSSGLFHLNLIPAGSYKVDVSAQGFMTAVLSHVQVNVGSDQGLGTLMLAVGETSKAVEVATTAPLIETTQAQVTNVFSGNVLEKFPNIQENEGLDRLALFVPGVTLSRSNNFSNVNGAGIASNGLRGRNNDEQIDGQFNNDNSVAGPGLFMSDPEFVQQYTIVTNNFGSEYGRNAGSVVNIITKQGTSGWHGSVYETENNSFVNALNNTQRNTNKPGSAPCQPGQSLICNGFSGPPHSNDEFGGFTVSGPAVKNKVFLFGGFSQEIFSGHQVDTTSSLTPTPTGLTQLAACPGINATALSIMQIFGPYGVGAGGPVPRNVTTTNITNPITHLVVCPNVEVGGVTRVVPTPFHNFNWILRADTQLSPSDNFTGRYLFNQMNNFNNSDNGAGGWFEDVLSRNQSVLLTETHNFSSRMVNEGSVSFNRIGAEFGGGLNPLEPTAGSLSSAFTNISILGALGLGPSTNLPQSRKENVWQLQDNWNYILGRHSFKAGVNWSYQRSPNILLPDINGAYRFSTLSSFFTTFTPSRVQIAQGDSDLDFREYDTFLYFGDDWKIGRNLTLNLGLTWTYYGQPANLFNQVTTARESNPATALWLQTLPLSVRTDPSIPSVKNSFGPSVGFAYNPQWGGWITGQGKTTIRGGYRLLYDPPFYSIFLNGVATGAPATFLQTITTGLNASMLPAVPIGPNVRAALGAFLTPNTFDPRTQSETTLSPNFGPDKVNEWTLGFERQITNNTAFEARYAGNHGFNLFQTVDGNPYVGTTGTTTLSPGPPPNIVGGPGLGQLFPSLANGLTAGCAATTQSGPANTIGTDVGRVNCGQGVVRLRNNSGYSNYNALQVEFRANNLLKQLTMMTGYTWSKTSDNTSEMFSTNSAGNTSFAAQNPFQTGGPEYATSGLSFPQAWTIAFTEQIPFFKEQKGVVGRLLGGWGISATYLLESGQPFTPIQGLFGPFAQETTCGFFTTNCSPHATPGANFYDAGFNSAFVGIDTARPFIGSPSAPASSVGIMAGDACTFFGVGCSSPATQLISFNALNASGGAANTPQFFGCLRGTATCQVADVTNNQVRFIINGSTAQSVFGTPFGNMPRNALRDAISNIANVSVFKTFKLGERAAFEMHATALNAFNHFNFNSIDPFVEDAGLAGSFGSGFANPSVTPASGRTLYVGGKVSF
jgi:hypothetical protein